MNRRSSFAGYKLSLILVAGLFLSGCKNEQHPFAAIVCCSDSRVPPELLFDQGLGDVFVIRTAGNVISGVEMGSIEYAVEHLGVKLVMVLGYEKCGAV